MKRRRTAEVRWLDVMPHVTVRRTDGTIRRYVVSRYRYNALNAAYLRLRDEKGQGGDISAQAGIWSRALSRRQREDRFAWLR